MANADTSHVILLAGNSVVIVRRAIGGHFGYWYIETNCRLIIFFYCRFMCQFIVNVEAKIPPRTTLPIWV